MKLTEIKTGGLMEKPDKNTKVFVGDVKFSDLTDWTTTEALEIITGRAVFQGSNILELTNLQEVGSVSFDGCRVHDTGSLEKVYGEADFRGSSVVEIKRLREVLGNLLINGTKIDNVDAVEHVGGDLNAFNSSLTHLNPDTVVDGRVIVNQSFIKNVGEKKEKENKNVSWKEEGKDDDVISRGRYNM